MRLIEVVRKRRCFECPIEGRSPAVKAEVHFINVEPSFCGLTGSRNVREVTKEPGIEIHQEDTNER